MGSSVILRKNTFVFVLSFFSLTNYELKAVKQKLVMETKVSCSYVECFVIHRLPLPRQFSQTIPSSMENTNDPLRRAPRQAEHTSSQLHKILHEHPNDTIWFRDIFEIRNFCDFNFQILKLLLLILFFLFL